MLWLEVGLNMKRVDNIYNKICDIDNIMDMAHKVVINTTNKRKVDRFETFYSEEIVYIKSILENKSYIPGKYNIFLIREPKMRLIMSSSIRDKIVNHLVSKYFLVDYFDGSFIESNIATRRKKGTHYGLGLVKKYINECKRKGNVYYLKIDIKKYFYNIDHNIVKNLVRRRIKDKDALDIIDKIIDSTDECYVNEDIEKIKNNEIDKVLKSSMNIDMKRKKIEEIEMLPLYKKGKGFSIGNMSSQIVGIMYLSELDHFIKEKLHIKYYVRYMDDMVLIHNDKKYLKNCLCEIEKLLNKYLLQLNYKKTYVSNINNGLEFLGFVFYLKNNRTIMKLKNETKKRYIKRCKHLHELKSNNLIDDKFYSLAMNACNGHLKWGNCNRLINTYK